jgi:rhodanese-related sulfurtransferase
MVDMRNKMLVILTIVSGFALSLSACAKEIEVTKVVKEEVVVTATPKPEGAVTFSQMVGEAMAGVPGISAEEAHLQIEEDQRTLVIDPRDAEDILATTDLISGAMNISYGSLTLRADMVAEALTEVSAVSLGEALLRIQQNPKTLVIDVRDPADIMVTDTIPGAINVPLGSLTYKADNEVPEEWRNLQLQDRSRPVITTSNYGPMGALGGKMLKDMGFTDVSYLEGGTLAWIDAGYPTE